jgi:very-short-patch-repair endonuclease
MAKRLTILAKALRKNSTDAEGLLWGKLRGRQLEGTKFRRQQPIDDYIVDFVSFEQQLVIELDGGQHARMKERDRERDRILEESGFRVLRFWNNDVLNNTDGVLQVVRKMCLK